MGVTIFGTGYLFLSNNKAKADEQQSLREKLIQNYENRIRNLSTPEKVFAYFASVDKDGEALMTPEDFIRSLTPYDFPHGGVPSSKRNWSEVVGKIQIPAFFKFCDVNGDGLLSFAEYLFFITLLSIPEHEFRIAFKMIDADANGKIDQDEFLEVLNVMKNRSAVGQRQRTYGTPLTSEDNFKPGVLPFFFGEDGKKSLTFDQFAKFLQDLQEEVRKLEFGLYDKEKVGSISLRDFGRLLISHATLRNFGDYVKRVELIDPNEVVTFKEFSDFERLLNSLDDMQLAIETYGGDSHFTKETFAKAAFAVANVQLSKKQVDAVFAVFDADGDQKLEPEEFVNVMKRRKTRSLHEPRDLGFTRTVNCVSKCIKGQ